MPSLPPDALHFPATSRNRDAILAVLRRVLPPDGGTLLEIASGSGEHAVYFASALPGWTVQPSDPDPVNRASIVAWTASTSLSNVRAPLDLDATAEAWPLVSCGAVLCCNMIHIAPWEACLGLLAGAARVLEPGGPLVLYGPFKEHGVHTAPSNEAFDRDLRARNPAWGVRDLDQVVSVAARSGLVHHETVVMPANNRCVVFRR